nr:chromatin assembly factor 1 subunit A-B [Megalopta genalis]XP_033326884.1 chromatin assembly factor 1 subunit A-B [Megalopta genalis]XP_033326886.1 chromatin assembly factor 1 subunit A-B [Megalopta genalis]
MKMMENDRENNSCVDVNTPAKKKKLRQAQLPFQRSPIGSTSVTQTKKRKLSSPSMECKGIKISRKSKSMDRKITVDKLSIHHEYIDIADDSDMENLNENATTNKDQSKNKDTTSKQEPKEFQKAVVKLSPLTKYLTKTEEKVEASNVESSNKFELEANYAASQPGSSTQHTETLKNESVDKSDGKADDKSDDKLDGKTDDKLDDKLGDKSDDKLESKADNVASQSSNSKQETEINNSVNPNDSSVTVKSLDDESQEQSEEKLAENVDTSRKNINSSEPSTSTADQLIEKQLTPKQLERKLYFDMKREEKEKLRMERDRIQEERRKEKEEKRRQREEQRILEKSLKIQRRQQEYELKQKEKQAREVERRKRDEAREEEKRKKEEEKLEAERRKQKAASNFTSFFVAKKQKSVEEESTKKVQNFMPFEVKADMKLAPVCRRNLSEEEKDTLDNTKNRVISEAKLYLSNLKNKKIVPRKSSKTWPLETKDDDVVLLDDDNDGNANIVNQDIVVEKQRTKLLQFKENRRPPYWGTWRKRSEIINPRKPFSKDEKWFNYEIDSDEEWEEEEPGESLHGSDEEKDEENPEDNEYDVDNEFMVPHGYLSEEELRADEEDKEGMTPETHKFKLKVLGEQFESERNTKTSKLKPKIVGCVWRGLENSFSENVPPRTRDFLLTREAWVQQTPVSLPTAIENDAGAECGTTTDQSTPKHSRKSRFPAEAIPELIRLLHGNTHGRGFLVKEFFTFWNKKHEPLGNQISKSSLMHKIRDLGKWTSCPEEGPMHLKPCWYVPQDIRKKYLEEDLQLPNQWSYNLIPKRKRMQMMMEVEEKEEDKKNVPLITQFTKKITQEEMKKQLTVDKPVKPPKRAILISVAREEQLPSTSRDSPLKKFITNEKKADTQKYEDDTDDDIVILVDQREEADKKKNVKTIPNVVKSRKKKKVSPRKITNSSKQIKIKIENKSATGSVSTSVDVEEIN